MYAIFDKKTQRYVQHVASYGSPRHYGFTRYPAEEEPIALFAKISLAKSARTRLNIKGDYDLIIQKVRLVPLFEV